MRQIGEPGLGLEMFGLFFVMIVAGALGGSSGCTVILRAARRLGQWIGSGWMSELFCAASAVATSYVSSIDE